jgi:hypothetical protein
MLLLENSLFKIRDKKGRKVNFKPNTVQSKLLEIIKEEKRKNGKVFINIVKARQIGVSALLARLPLSYAMSQPNFTAFTVAHTDEAVRSIFRNHIKYSFDTLAPEIRSLYKVDTNAANSLRFSSPECENSSITVGTSSRSQTINYTHVSETAYIFKFEHKKNELLTGTMEAGGEGDIIWETTARGMDDFYDLTMQSLEDPFSPMKTVFLSWFHNEEYRLPAPNPDLWLQDYKKLAETYGLKADPVKDGTLDIEQLYFYYQKTKTLKEFIKQEYPLSLEEAFISSGQSVFNLKLLDSQDRNRIKEFETISGVQIYKKPVKGHRYIIGLDSASGNGGDDSCASVLDVNTLEQVAEIAGNLDPVTLATIACNLGKMYNQALLVPERNGLGIATVNEILRLNYPTNLIYRQIAKDTDPRSTSSVSFGYNTTSITRPVMIYELKEAIDDEVVKINSHALIKQCRSFEFIDGKPQGAGAASDDRIFAFMLALQGLKFLPFC